MPRAQGHGRKCSFELENGATCQAWALRESQPPLCRAHALSPEERSAMARQMARKSAVVRRGDTEARPSSDLDPGISLREVLQVLRPMLTATFSHDRSPDYGSRGLAALVLVTSFPRFYRSSPSEMRRLLEEVLPADVQETSPELLEAERVFRLARAEWWALPAWHPIRGLVPRPLPRSLVPPWQAYQLVVRAEAPRDVPPEEAPVVHFPDGRVALKRGSELPVVLEEVNDGGLIRV
jgi:hypothetical protein